MAAPAPQVAVVGMAALRRDINRLADDTQSRLYAAIKAAGRQAAEPIAARARADYPHDSGTLAGDIRVSGTKTGAAVRVGRVTVPYAGWVDFGGSRPDGSTREYRPAGRYLFPAAAGLADRAAELYGHALEAVFSDPAVWTNTTDSAGGVHD